MFSIQDRAYIQMIEQGFNSYMASWGSQRELYLADTGRNIAILVQRFPGQEEDVKKQLVATLFPFGQPEATRKIFFDTFIAIKESAEPRTLGKRVRGT